MTESDKSSVGAEHNTSRENAQAHTTDTAPDSTPTYAHDEDATRIVPNHTPTAPISQPVPSTPASPNAHAISQPHNLIHEQTTPSVLEAGIIIKDRFVLEECIGRGGMGTVFKALDLRKQEMQDQAPYVAIKFLNEELQDRSDALIALQREAKKAQTLAHPNIITVYDFDREGGRVYLSMEYLEGKTLDQLIRDGFYNKKDTEKILRIIDRIARGLAYAHQRGFVHADLKPSNVFLTNDGTVKLLDFGIAQAVRHPHAEKVSDHTHFDPHSLGAITPRYASVEMLDGQVPVPADDMFALGCIAYALFTGHHPFRNAENRPLTAEEAQARQLSLTPIPFLPKTLMTTLQKCLQFKRADRFNNAGELLDALKPPAKLNRRIVSLMALLLLVATTSWWVTLEQSTVTVTLNDLPKSMEKIQQTLVLGDERFTAEDIDQAYKLYAQAWEDAAEVTALDPRDRLNLKVLIDRRVDRIANQLMQQVDTFENEHFRLIQLQLSLEFLQKAPIGTRQDQITKTIKKISRYLDRESTVAP